MGSGLASCTHKLRSVLSFSQLLSCHYRKIFSLLPFTANCNKYSCLFMSARHSNNCGSQPKLLVKMDNPNSSEAAGSVVQNAVSIMKDKDSEHSEQHNKSGVSEAKPMSKKALRRMARAQKHKEYKKKKKAEALQLCQKNDAGYCIEDFDDSSYYFENGLRKVYPYPYVFATHAKGRWIGRTIQNVLEGEFGFDQPDDLEKAFNRGMIHVNSKQVSCDYVLHENDYISHQTHRHENPVTAAPIEIIEDNDDLVVINKPSSIPCHPCGRYRFNSVVFILGKEMGLTNLRNIYRLDRLTSGILMLGKSVEKTKTLMDQVVKRQVQKEYVCRVVGKFPEGTIKVDQPLQALSNKLRLQVISPKGKASQTTFTCMSYNGKSSVVRCLPHTGRTHQIRVHLQYLGHPIINDIFYNNDAWGPNKGRNGLYEVPFDQVCDRILADHHRTMWDGGENPFYEERLRDLKADTSYIKTPAASNDTDVTRGKCPADSATDIKDLADTTVNNEPPAKRPKKENGDSNSSSCVHSGKSQDVLQQHSDNPGLPLDSKQFISSTFPLDSTPNTGKESGQSSVDIETRLAEEPTTVTLQLSGVSSSPGFELAKWIPDSSCELCKKRHIDPGEKDLVMFLHAFKYKGPGWAYKSALPEWAQDDWCREDEYGIDGLSSSKPGLLD